MEFLREDNFLEQMEQTVVPWLKATTEEGTLVAADGLKLRYYMLKNPEERGSVTIIHGYCEYFGKYHELAYYFYQAGYSIYILEQRGHGYSERDGVENDMVYVQSFDDYVRDQKQFHDEVVVPNTKGECYLLAHSMGGLVGSLYLEEYPEDFKAAVLSSPLHEMNPGSIPQWAVSLLVAVATVLRWDRKYIPGHHGFVDQNVFERSSTRSKPRYDYAFELRRKDTHYQTSGASYAWSRASLRAVKKAHKNAAKIKTPFIILQAGKDTMVKIEGQDEFLRKCTCDCSLISFPESKHEVFNSLQEDRDRFYEEIFAFLKKF